MFVAIENITLTWIVSSWGCWVYIRAWAVSVRSLLYLFIYFQSISTEMGFFYQLLYAYSPANSLLIDTYMLLGMRIIEWQMIIIISKLFNINSLKFYSQCIIFTQQFFRPPSCLCFHKVFLVLSVLYPLNFICPFFLQSNFVRRFSFNWKYTLETENENLRVKLDWRKKRWMR